MFGKSAKAAELADEIHDFTAVRGRSLWRDALDRFLRNKAAMVSLVYLVLMTVVCVFGPWFVPHNYTTIYADYVRTPPSVSACVTSWR